MKASKILQTVCLALSLLATACTDTTYTDTPNRVAEGLPARLLLKFEVKDSPVLTRAAQDADYENRVENLYVFIFDSNGSVHNQMFCTPGKGLSYEDGTTSYSTGTANITTSSINNATVVAVANVTDGNTATAYTVTPADLDAVTNLNDLKALVARMDVATIFRGSTFMMTGSAQDDNNNIVVNIPGGEAQPLTIALPLERIDAKVKFVVKAEVPDGKDWTGFKFQPKEWRVMRVPKQSYLVAAEAGGDYDGTDAVYFDTEYRVFEDKSTDATGGGSFVFYMPENKKAPKADIVVTETTDEAKKAAYALREKRDKTDYMDYTKPGQTEQNGAFTYANANSTYVEMTGLLSYIDSKNYNVTADVKLIVHLGYAVPEGSSQKPNVNDYNTLRNGSYTYNLTIKGIDNIIVEVTNEDGKKPEPRPGYEGSVSYAEEQVFELDAHYDRSLLQFPVNHISNQLTWAVETPFSSGVNPEGSSVAKGLEDYKWVKFAINRDYGVTDPNKYVKYPGDQNYKGGADEPSPYYNNGKGGSYPNARLLDVVQLIERLKEEKEKYDKNETNIANGDGTITITAFIDEYIYVQDPTADHATTDLSLWKRCTNANDRLLHIIPSELRYSPDGNSSIVNTIFTFKQRAVQTVYNVDNPDLATAWGLESVMEGDRLPVDEKMPVGANNTDNGRFNTWTYFSAKGGGKTLKWTDVLSVEEHYKLDDKHNNVFYATLLRNRDLNGDNIVDENEIRWYLAAINQLTDIYLGEYALDQNVRLYPYDPMNEVYPDNGKLNNPSWHYASSTYHQTRDNINCPFVVWAEVGVGKGNYTLSKTSERNGPDYSYRCIRNLGISLDDLTTPPMDLVIYNATDRTFDLSRMSPKALRSFYVPEAGTYPVHTERSSYNLPYRKFQVSQERKPTSSDQGWDYFQTNNPFSKDGYRVPNMRELLIFTSRMTGLATSGHILSFTGFSMRHLTYYTNQGTDRKGYSFNLGDKSMGAGNNYGKVYGVRDIND